MNTGRMDSERTTEHHPERLPSPELDEDRLAPRQVREARRHCVRVGSRAPAARGIDRNLDASPLPARDRGRRPAQQSFLLDHHPLIVAGHLPARFRPGRGGPDGGDARPR